MTYEEITLSKEAPVARLTLNTPRTANALSERMIAELSHALDEIAAQKDILVVILAAAGKHFCAGHRLDEMVDKGAEDYRRIFANCGAMMERLHRLPQTVIAQVRGVATAAGCQLVAACDLAVASTDARFGTPGVKIGLFCGTPAVPLARVVGRRRALEMLLTGRLVSAREALDWGLVNKLAVPEDLEDETEDMAQQVAKASGLTLALGKGAFYEQVDRPEPEAYNLATNFMALSLGMADAQEGIKAFLEKREPKWQGR